MFLFYFEKKKHHPIHKPENKKEGWKDELA